MHLHCMLVTIKHQILWDGRRMASYGREDGTSASRVAASDYLLLEWLKAELSNPYHAPSGKLYYQVFTSA